ncbi:potassium channel family protein [Desulforamulus aeronauticus]|uniref:Trk system potassium uptake protein TrkA n=1 Tax=Desulforamulus aeronauticus DSM 10349 TaxID=1121421 RepID=A0A1M6UIH9_9FIRM|nr:TrkA family potassium uptake protein [Desulforamulus aeronauticus]SHK69045.1 trk system potassium uptake protein TrkA [Desulforamulus aeronauticus DSM 10349]
MKKSFIVVGVGRFGRGVIEGLYEKGHDIFAVDVDEEALDPVREMIVSGAILDVGEDDEELIKIVGEKNFDEAVVAIGQEFEGALIATHILKEAGIPVSVKASSERRGNVLSKMGADRVVFPERDIGRRLAHIISNDTVIDLLELPQGFVVEQIEVGIRFTGRTFVEMDIPKRFGVYILLVYRGNETIQPVAATVLKAGDEIVVFGERVKLAEFEKENFKEKKGR